LIREAIDLRFRTDSCARAAAAAQLLALTAVPPNGEAGADWGAAKQELEADVAARVR
jgi:hypothetical protein